MIYYLGETVRYQEVENADPANFPRMSWAAIPRVARQSAMYEMMFYGASHLARG